MGITGRTNIMPHTRAEAVFRHLGMKHDRLRPEFISAYERLDSHCQMLDMFPRGDEFFGLIKDIKLNGTSIELTAEPCVGEQVLGNRNFLNILDRQEGPFIDPSKISGVSREGEDFILTLSENGGLPKDPYGAYSVNTLNWYFPFRRMIRASYGDETIRVYQNMNDEGADYFLDNQVLPGSFLKRSRVWIKPSFLWTMKRSEWGTAPGRERVIAVDLLRSTFEGLIERSHLLDPILGIHYYSESGFYRDAEINPNYVQWDPDKDQGGARMFRRSLMLGIAPQLLGDYERGIVALTDISGQVRDRDSVIPPFEFAYPTPLNLLNKLEMHQYCLSETPVAKKWLESLIRE